MIVDMIRDPSGDEAVKFMTAPSVGEELVKQFSNIPKGINFNRPTGILFTESQLLAQLKKYHAAEVSRRSANSGN